MPMSIGPSPFVCVWGQFALVVLLHSFSHRSMGFWLLFLVCPRFFSRLWLKDFPWSFQHRSRVWRDFLQLVHHKLSLWSRFWSFDRSNLLLQEIKSCSVRTLATIAELSISCNLSINLLYFLRHKSVPLHWRLNFLFAKYLNYWSNLSLSPTRKS